MLDVFLRRATISRLVEDLAEDYIGMLPFQSHVIESIELTENTRCN
jgi:hypothetical protein